MGLFKSAEERRLERDIKIRQGIRRIEKAITEQNKFSDEFVKNARNAKQIGKGLEAQILLTAADPVYSVLTRYQDQLRHVFIVSAVSVKQAAPGNGTAGVSVEVSAAAGSKCERCWNYSTRVGEDSSYPTVCERCSAALTEIEAASAAR